jgi:hypothetical protein
MKRAMNTRRCLKIAARMNGLLKRELGQGLVPARMLAEPLYARDVLLVCEAVRGSELPDLAARFRRALAAEAEDTAAPRRTGLGASRFLSSLFGPSSGLGAANDGAAQAESHGWFGRSRSAVK